MLVSLDWTRSEPVPIAAGSHGCAFARPVPAARRSSNSEFYAVPRLVTHIDDATIAALTAFYGKLIPEGGACWTSCRGGCRTCRRRRIRRRHRARHERRGAGRERRGSPSPRRPGPERGPALPFDDGAFDAVVNTVSVQYLTRPVEVFAEVGRVLRPGGLHIVATSHLMFPPRRSPAGTCSSPPTVCGSSAATSSWLVGTTSHASSTVRRPTPTHSGSCLPAGPSQPTPRGTGLASERQVPLLTLTTPERRVRQDHPDPADQAAGGRGAGPALARVRDHVQRAGPALDPARGAAQELPADRALQRAQRAAILRAAAVRSPLPLLPRPEPRRGRLRRLVVRQEQGAAAGADVARRFFEGVVQQAKAGRLLLEWSTAAA